MTCLTKLLAIATASLAFAFTASAETRFEATLYFVPGKLVEATYTDLSREAARACRKELSLSGRVDLGVARRFKTECHAELLQHAIRQINDPVLTAYYNKGVAPLQQLASR